MLGYHDHNEHVLRAVEVDRLNERRVYLLQWFGHYLSRWGKSHDPFDADEAKAFNLAAQDIGRRLSLLSSRA